MYQATHKSHTLEQPHKATLEASNSLSLKTNILMQILSQRKLAVLQRCGCRFCCCLMYCRVRQLRLKTGSTWHSAKHLKTSSTYSIFPWVTVVSARITINQHLSYTNNYSHIFQEYTQPLIGQVGLFTYTLILLLFAEGLCKLPSLSATVTASEPELLWRGACCSWQEVAMWTGVLIVECLLHWPLIRCDVDLFGGLFVRRK